MAEHTPKQKYLAVHDYGMGGTWVFVWARDAEEIHKRLPELKIMDEYPSWLNGDQLKRVEDTRTFDIDEIKPDDWIARLGHR
jgi:hypothetical protein